MSASSRCPTCMTIGASVSRVAVPNASWINMTIESMLDHLVTLAAPAAVVRNQPATNSKYTLVRIDKIG